MYTTRVNVFTGRMIHAPGSKLVPTLAREENHRREELASITSAFIATSSTVVNLFNE